MPKAIRPDRSISEAEECDAIRERLSKYFDGDKLKPGMGEAYMKALRAEGLLKPTLLERLAFWRK